MSYISEFEDFIRFTENLAENTVNSYITDIMQFVEFAGTEIPSKANVTEFVYFLYQKGNNTTTIRRKLSSISKYSKFLMLKGKIKENPVEDLSRPKVWERLPRYLGKDEIEKLLVMPDTTTENGVRDRAILELMYASGLRVSEVLNLKVEDVDFEKGIIFVKEGKGKKDRVVPIGKIALFWLKEYLRIRKRNSNYLFTGKKGERLTRQRLWQIIREYARKAEIDITISPHTIRHTFATHLLLGGADIRSLQELLGHSSIRTTEIYTHLANPELEKLFRKYHPRKKIR